MKKTFLILATLVMMSVNVFADGLTATLQQGDKMTPFYGVDAFKNAYAAADSGAVITLSAGKFNIVNRIEKPMKIVGNFGLDASSVERTILTSLNIAANKVTIDGIYFFSSVTLGNISDCKISHSWIDGILRYASTESWHTNTVVDQCVIKRETAIKQGKNYTIKNSTVGRFEENNSASNVAYISNCIVYYLYYASLSGHSSDYCLPFAIYKNNILGFYRSSSSYTANYYFSSPSEFYNNYFLHHGSFITAASFSEGCINQGNINAISSTCDFIVEKYPNTDASFGNGQDGTPIGVTGGTGFTLYPNIPRITSSTIDSNTDNDGKLNVTIKVSVP